MCHAVQTTEDALATRLLQATIHTLELFGIYLGKQLGLYEALNAGRRITPPELAHAADTVRELARASGFSQVEVVAVDGGFFRLYRLRAH